jgi:hypothetical protein
MESLEISKQTVIATTTRYPENDPLSPVRSIEAVKFVELTIKEGYQVIIVDGGSFSEFIVQIKDLGADVYFETKETRGMGPSRRYAFEKAYQTLKPCIVWPEPEKWPLIKELPKLVTPILEGKADLVIPKRRSLDSYPVSQRYEESFGNIFLKELIGEFFDWWFGPRIGTREVFKQYFMKYRGKELLYENVHGDEILFFDQWDSILCPGLHAFSDGKKLLSVDVDYTHPEGQTKAEEGDVGMTLLRKRQLELMPMCYTYWTKYLGNKNGIYK